MKPLARKDGVFIEELAQDYVVFNSRTNKAHNLNQPLYWLWQHCDGTSDLQELTSHFGKHFTTQDAPSLVMSGVKQLYEADLLLPTEDEALEALSAAPVISRRALVTGGSAFIPLMSTVLVPTAAAAKSNRGKGKGKDKDDKGKGKGKGKDKPGRR